MLGGGADGPTEQARTNLQTPQISVPAPSVDPVRVDLQSPRKQELFARFRNAGQPTDPRGSTYSHSRVDLQSAGQPTDFRFWQGCPSVRRHRDRE